MVKELLAILLLNLLASMLLLKHGLAFTLD